MNVMSKHRFDQASWRIIKEFVGIYGLKMDYSAIFKLTASDIHDAMRYSNVIATPFFTMRRNYNRYRHPIAWKTLLLKKAAMGHKNCQFYQELELLVG